ncbi:MAG: inorganic diphosphatase [Eubacteriales bacterium]|jgi:inorganic pyrophosphatase
MNLSYTAYTEENKALRRQLLKAYLGKAVHIEIDRPIGFVHKKEKYTLTYPINYGFVPKVIGGDGEELDVYLLGVAEPVKEYTGVVIAAACRENDGEDKLVMAPHGMRFTAKEIEEQIHFQEKYYKTSILLAEETEKQ